MRLSLVFYAFLARTAFGTLATLLLVMRMRAAERHVRFQCVLALMLASAAAALYLPGLGDEVRPALPRGVDAFLSADGGVPVSLALTGVACLFANLFFATFRRGIARAALVTATVLAAVAVFGTARLPPGDGAGAVAARTGLGLLGGSVMGGVNGAMILGHFYLMIKGLPLQALARTGVACAVLVIVRMVGFGVVLLAWPGAADELLGPREVIWTTWRVCFGFVGPLTLVWMTRDALKFRHTQAATGILYVALFFALMGELAATWIEFRTGIPV
jgi:hypothetical protein